MYSDLLLILLNSKENTQIGLFCIIVSLVFIHFILYIYSYNHMSDFWPHIRLLNPRVIL